VRRPACRATVREAHTGAAAAGRGDRIAGLNGTAFRSFWRVETRLDRLFLAGEIDAQAYQAALAFRRDCELIHVPAASPLVRAGLGRAPLLCCSRAITT
jgi:hypothetical protein